MPATAENLIAWRDSLIRSRLRGVRRVRDANGEEVEYRSDVEMARAIASADALIAEAQRGQPITTVRFRTSKGI